MSNLSPIYQKSISNLKSLIFDTLKEEDVTVILFGYRTRGDFNQVSDIDIGVLLGKNFDRRKLIFLKDRIEDLNIPYTVDIVDLSRFRKILKKRRYEKELHGY